MSVDNVKIRGSMRQASLTLHYMVDCLLSWHHSCLVVIRCVTPRFVLFYFNSVFEQINWSNDTLCLKNRTPYD